MKRNDQRAFSLVELMTVIVIIGVLTTVAIPAYREYVYNAKIAEGYVGVEALTKAQKIYFLDNHYFLYMAISIDGGDGITQPYNLQKNPITVAGGPSDPCCYNSFKALGEPIPNNTASYFAYHMYAGGWDESSDPYHSYADSEGNSFVLSGPGVPTTTFAFVPRIPDKRGDIVGSCNSGLTQASLGFTPAANRKIIFIGASAPLKGSTSQCTFIFQTMIADNDEILTSPMVTMRE